jgi:hypothetical protein
LTFESIPQILFQSYLYLRLRSDEDERTELGIELYLILVSILFSMGHALIEFVVLKAESTSTKTSLTHYYMCCLNGRFGWVPFENIFADENASTISQTLTELDYANLSSKLLCLNYNQEY